MPGGKESIYSREEFIQGSICLRRELFQGSICSRAVSIQEQYLFKVGGGDLFKDSMYLLKGVICSRGETINTGPRTRAPETQRPKDPRTGDPGTQGPRILRAVLHCSI